jgi:tight adherence protein C
MSLELTLTLVFAAAAAFALAVLSLWRHARRHRKLVKNLQQDTGETFTYEHRRPKEGRLARFGRRVNRGAERDSRLKLRLARAGWDSRTAPLTYSAAQLWLLVSMPLVGTAAAYSLNRRQEEVVLAAIVGLLVAWIIPKLYVARRARQRRRTIQKSLPDALDLMVVCVEAGVGIDAAILRVSDELGLSHPDLAYEFQVVNQRVNAGLPRIEALREMVARTNVDDLRSLVTTLIQSEKLGVSIARVLRVSSDSLRTKRRQQAEQAARKAPIKMLVPMIFFILPALMAFILGPAGFHIMEALKSARGP